MCLRTMALVQVTRSLVVVSVGWCIGTITQNQSVPEATRPHTTTNLFEAI